MGISTTEIIRPAGLAPYEKDDGGILLFPEEQEKAQSTEAPFQSPDQRAKERELLQRADHYARHTGVREGILKQISQLLDRLEKSL